MEITTKKLKLSQIKLNPDNPRRIGKVEMERLVKSLQDFPEMMELREIIVDENNTILGGNMRYRALKQIGEKECIAKIVTGLTVDQKREFIIKDNSNFGSYDMDALANLWSDLPLVEWGVDLPEDWLVEEKTDPADAEPQMDKAAELNKVWKVAPGDLWQIGSHRLLCGDSTKAEDVARVMGNDKPLLMVTDPPYGIDYDPEWRNEAAAKGLIGQKKSSRAVGKVANDDNADWTTAYELCGCDVVYIWHAGIKSNVVQDSIIKAGYDVRTQIIWAKNNFAIGRGHYQPKHEPCFYAVKKGATGLWVGGHSETTVWDIPKNLKNESGHSTEKPLECMARPIRNHDSEFVYDPFLGSGTTMVACQNLNRKCRGIEISENYCAVILQRMTDAFPGIEIRRIDK